VNTAINLYLQIEKPTLSLKLFKS